VRASYLLTQVVRLLFTLWLGEGLAAAADSASTSSPPPGRINVRGEPGAVLFFDGRQVGTLPLLQPLLAPAGQHRVRLNYGRRHREGPIEVLPNRLLEVQFEGASGAVVMNVVPALLFLPRERFADAAARPHREALEKIFESRKMSLIDEGTALAQTARLKACMQTTTCQLELARQYGADYVLIGALIEQRDKAGFRVTFTLLDAEAGETASATEWSCERCAADDLAAHLPRLTEKLLGEGLLRARGTLVVRTQPPGAVLRIDDRTVGITPYERPSLAREFELHVTHPGYREARRRVRIEAEKKQEVDITLARQSAEPVREKRRPLWRLAIGGAALTAGVLLLGFGAAALSQNDECVSPKPPLAEFCRRVYDTNRLGGGLLGVGIPFLAFGAIFMALPPR
jgi:hypothetical protein